MRVEPNMCVFALCVVRHPTQPGATKRKTQTDTHHPETGLHAKDKGQRMTAQNTSIRAQRIRFTLQSPGTIRYPYIIHKYELILTNHCQHASPEQSTLPAYIG